MRRFLKPCFRSAMLAAPLLPILVPVAAYADGDAKAGERAFTSKCASCHRVGPNARGGFGPQLNGIIGRQAGTTDYRYSDAMKTAGFAWSEDRLRAFVKSPGKVVPGNKMLFWGMRDEQEINDLLAYLRTFP